MVAGRAIGSRQPLWAAVVGEKKSDLTRAGSVKLVRRAVALAPLVCPLPCGSEERDQACAQRIKGRSSCCRALGLPDAWRLGGAEQSVRSTDQRMARWRLQRPGVDGRTLSGATAPCGRCGGSLKDAVPAVQQAVGRDPVSEPAAQAVDCRGLARNDLESSECTWGVSPTHIRSCARLAHREIRSCVRLAHREIRAVAHASLTAFSARQPRSPPRLRARLHA
jgi:hypothetical protein